MSVFNSCLVTFFLYKIIFSHIPSFSVLIQGFKIFTPQPFIFICFFSLTISGTARKCSLHIFWVCVLSSVHISFYSFWEPDTLPRNGTLTTS